jgi:hypothetical protein
MYVPPLSSVFAKIFRILKFNGSFQALQFAARMSSAMEPSTQGSSHCSFELMQINTHPDLIDPVIRPPIALFAIQSTFSKPLRSYYHSRAIAVPHSGH